MGRDFADICDNVCKAVDFKKLVKEKIDSYYLSCVVKNTDFTAVDWRDFLFSNPGKIFFVLGKKIKYY